jgi:hypothetical protein
LFDGRGGYVTLRNGGKFSLADDYAVLHGCDAFYEFHLNAGGGTGTEVLYSRDVDKARAALWSKNLAHAIDVANRGPKDVTDIAVLRTHPGMQSLLVEMWFADSKNDKAKWDVNHDKAELANLNQILDHYGWNNVKSLPRNWSKAMRKKYTRG